MAAELSQPDHERLSAWMDGELSPAEAETVARLVETDPAWTEAYRRLRSLNRTLDRWDVPTPPADLADRVLRHARRKPEPVVYRLSRWILSAAAVMLIGVGLWLHFAQKRQASPGRNPAQATLTGVPESFVRENADVFHYMPENIPAKGPVRIVITRPASSATQPAVQVYSWNQLTPQQQQAVRKRAVIFLRLSPEQQAKLLRAHERARHAAKLHKQMSWLKPVLESFTPAQRARLRDMTPAQRGQLFLQRRNELIRAGTLIKKSPNTNTSPFLVSPSSPSPEP